jgi:Rrf2 family iron-sulfur cluster assembly transcriptional regulator
MIEIARTETPMPLHSVADTTGISLSYLEQLAATLRSHGLIKAKLGPKGGYVLAKPSASITIADIVKASEDWAPGLKAPKNKDVPQPTNTVQLWSHIHNVILHHLSQITLEYAIVERNRFDHLIP